MTDHCTQCSAVIGDGDSDVVYQPYTFFDFSLGEERMCFFDFNLGEEGRLGFSCLFAGYVIDVQPVWCIL